MERADAEAIYEQGRDVVVAVLLRLDEQVQRLEKRVVAQDERIAKLERQLNRSSRNSSQPPSADAPSVPPCAKSPTGRKQGAQPGHEGKGRPLLPAWAVDEVVDHTYFRGVCPAARMAALNEPNSWNTVEAAGR